MVEQAASLATVPFGGTTGAAAVKPRFDPLNGMIRLVAALVVDVGVAFAWVAKDPSRFEPGADSRLLEYPALIGAASAATTYLLLTYLRFRVTPVRQIRARATRRRRLFWLRRLFPARAWIGVYLAWLAVGVAADLPRATKIEERYPGQLKAAAALLVVLLWFIVHSMYAEAYATRYYRDDGGLDFNGDTEPDYRDFAYFAYSIGMTFGTTDVSVTSKRFRRAMLPHKLFSFGYNTAILALVLTFLFQ